jgi:hypothetical protein
MRIGIREQLGAVVIFCSLVPLAVLAVATWVCFFPRPPLKANLFVQESRPFSHNPYLSSKLSSLNHLDWSLELKSWTWQRTVEANCKASTYR